eukprot:scaffold97857_cov63-Phaeocystis_antarctica.AAC.1
MLACAPNGEVPRPTSKARLSAVPPAEKPPNETSTSAAEERRKAAAPPATIVAMPPSGRPMRQATAADQPVATQCPTKLQPATRKYE